MFDSETSGSTHCDGFVQRLTCAVDGAQQAVSGAASAANFWTDPAGNTYKMLRDGASGLATQLLPQLSSATMPDLTADWFLRVYAVTFALAILVMVVLMMPQFIRTARGAQSGRALIDSIGLFLPLFLLGSMFGPLIGATLVSLVKTLSDSIAAWGIIGSTDTATLSLTNMLSEKDPLAFAGGSIAAVLLMLGVLLALLLVVGVLIVQLVTLYFAGVMIPLGLVWIIDPTKRRTGTRIVGLWVGILFAHPLLFLLLALAFFMFSSSINFLGNDASLQKTAQLLAAMIAMFVAAFSPLLLMKFAPVIPVGGGGSNGASLDTGSWGANNMGDAMQRFAPQARQGSAAAEVPAMPSAAAASASGSEGGLAAAAARSSAPAAAGAGSSAGTAAAGTGAAEGAAAAGAAEPATGAGAATGIPTLAAAGAMYLGSEALRAAEASADQATAPMDDMDGDS